MVHDKDGRLPGPRTPVEEGLLGIWRQLANVGGADRQADRWVVDCEAEVHGVRLCQELLNVSTECDRHDQNRDPACGYRQS
jgi:hypothetical protein